jgi:Uma2 family endonuclease
MAVAVAAYLDAIAHLPPGATLRTDDVSWDEYQRLLADRGDSSAVRIFYDRGRMEIMAPTSMHERLKSAVHRLVTVLGDELDIDTESLGSTTFRKQLRAVGAEPDDCFYVQSAGTVIGMERDLDLTLDPPPDLVVEIERTTSSLDKFPIYAALGVPEIWRVVEYTVRIYRLAGDRYEESAKSDAFPVLPATVLSSFLARAMREGERAAARAFRAWVQEQRRT